MASLEPLPKPNPDSSPLSGEANSPIAPTAGAMGNAAVSGEVGQRDISAELKEIRDHLPIDLHRAAHHLGRLNPLLQERGLAVVPEPMIRELRNTRLFQQRRLALSEGRKGVRLSEEEASVDGRARAAAFLADPDLVNRYLDISYIGATKAERQFMYFFQNEYERDPEALAYVSDLIRSTITRGSTLAGGYREVRGPNGHVMGHI